MRGRARGGLRGVWRIERAGREVLRWLRRTVTVRSDGAIVRCGGVGARSDTANRRAPPTDSPLLRPRRLDAALAAARRRGVARRGHALPRDGARRRRAFRRPRRAAPRRRAPRLLRLAD